MWMVLWNSLAFSMIQQMLTIWSLVPLTFLNPPWISGSSQFTYCWSLARRTLRGHLKFSSVCLTLCDPMSSTRPGLPVHHHCQSPPKPMDMSRWCHPTISSSVVPFSSCPQSFSASESFQMSQLFASGGQNTGVSVLISVLPMNTQDWSLFGWTGWIFLQFKGVSSVFSDTTLQKHQSWVLSFLYSPTVTSIHVVRKTTRQLEKQ